MDDKTKTALAESIKHWERLVACDSLNEVLYEGVKGSECALCAEFVENECLGCPVSDKTKEIACNGSPYHTVYKYFEKLFCSDEFNPTKWKELAQAELDFLKSLQPNEAAK